MARNRSDSVNEIASLWCEMMMRCKTISECIPGTDIKTLSDNEVYILRMIRNRQQIIIGDISTALNLPKSTVTGLIARLEKKELIKRDLNPNDLRTYRLLLSEKGTEALHKYRQYEQAFFSLLLKPLNEEESRAFYEILKSIVSRGGCANEKG